MFQTLYDAHDRMTCCPRCGRLLLYVLIENYGAKYVAEVIRLASRRSFGLIRFVHFLPAATCTPSQSSGGRRFLQKTGNERWRRRPLCPLSALLRACRVVVVVADELT